MLREVRRAMNAMLNKATEEANRPVAIASVDDSGNLLNYARMDGCRTNPLRKVATALFIIAVLLQKKLFRVDRQNDLTPLHQLGALSFWGVPSIDRQDYRLRVEGAVANPASFSFDDLKAMPSVRRVLII